MSKSEIERRRFIAAMGLLLVLVAGATGGICALIRSISWQMGAEISQKLREKFSKLPNYENGHFRNSQPIKLNFNGRSFTPSLLKRIFVPPDGPKKPIPQAPLTEKNFSDTPGEFSVRWLGHSTLIYELAGMRIITDPIFGNAAPIPFAVPRYCKSPLARKDLPKLDLVLLTHDHYDHLELATIEMLRKRKDLKFVTMLGVGEHLRKWGVPEDRITELYWGDSATFGRLTIRAAEARHFSGRSFGKRDTTLWGAFVLEFETSASPTHMAPSSDELGSVPCKEQSDLRGWGTSPSPIATLLEEGLGAEAETLKSPRGEGWGEEADLYDDLSSPINQGPAPRERGEFSVAPSKKTLRKIFHGGDGGYGDHFKKIGEAEGSFDLVCLEIDAWNLNWHGHHMFPHEAIKALQELNGRVILPIHWGVFDLAMHPWNESIEILANEAAAHGVQGAFPKMGQLVSLLDPQAPLPQDRWWRG